MLKNNLHYKGRVYILKATKKNHEDVRALTEEICYVPRRLNGIKKFPKQD